MDSDAIMNVTCDDTHEDIRINPVLLKFDKYIICRWPNVVGTSFVCITGQDRMS